MRDVRHPLVHLITIIFQHHRRSADREEDDDISDMEQDKVVHKSKDDDDDDEGDVPDLDTWNEDNNLLEGDGATVTSATSHTARTGKRRTYYILITYDKYYQTRTCGSMATMRMASPCPIWSSCTTTWVRVTPRRRSPSTHIHTFNLPFASIHPCWHTQVMKNIVDLMVLKNKQPCLFLFLKVLSAVIPTIEYNFTFYMDTLLK